jgi:hypothetical protein
LSTCGDRIAEEGKTQVSLSDKFTRRYLMQSTGATISQTVENLLAIRVSEDRDGLAGSTVRKVYTEKLKELAKHLGVSEAYLPRKIQAGTWDAKELDQLAEFFEMWPGDFVPGPEDEKTE